MTARTQMSTSLILLSVLLIGIVGCAPQSAPPTEPATLLPAPTPTTPPTLPSAPTPTAEANVPDGWETYSNQGQCSFAISHPETMDVTGEGTYSWLLSTTTTEPSGPVLNFVYVSVIPDGFQSNEGGVIYNYDPAETQTLLSMQVGESKSLREDPNIASSFTYTRRPDRTLSNQTAQAYENTQPWEFPLGTKEIRYYLKANGCTYMIGGYVSTADASQPGGIDEALFDQIIATFRLAL